MRRRSALLLALIIFILGVNIGLADPSFKVSGIMMGNQPVAIVNGKTVAKGDQVDGAEVEAITNDSVTLKYQGNVIVSKIEDGSSEAQDVENNEESTTESDTSHAEDEQQNTVNNETQEEENLDSNGIKSNNEASQSGDADMGQVTYLKNGYILAVSDKVFSEATQMQVEHDNEALGRLLLSGQIEYTDGQEVYVVSVHPFGGSAEVRIRGETDILWTNIEAVQ